MIIKVLIENTQTEGLLAEHGLSLYVEYKDKAYLIDSGASNLFALNAEKMDIDLDKVNKAFLSHAHYDHSGGFEAFFEKNKHAKVYLQKSAQNKYYFKIAGPLKKYIGIPLGLLDKYKDRFEYIDGNNKVDEGIYIVSHNSSEIIERAKKTHMCVECNNKVTFDDFSHEQTIVFEEEDGLVCFNSCSHAGVDTIIDEIKRYFPNKKIKAYIGGFHMMGITGISSCSYTKQEVQDVAKKLSETSDVKFYSGHCTGTIAYEWLDEILKERLISLSPGKVLQI